MDGGVVRGNITGLESDGKDVRRRRSKNVVVQRPPAADEKPSYRPAKGKTD